MIVNKKETLPCRPDKSQRKIKRKLEERKYLHLVKEHKLWNMKVTVIPIVIGALVTISIGLVKKTYKSEDNRRPSSLQYYYDQPEF